MDEKEIKKQGCREHTFEDCLDEVFTKASSDPHILNSVLDQFLDLRVGSGGKSSGRKSFSVSLSFLKLTADRVLSYSFDKS